MKKILLSLLAIATLSTSAIAQQTLFPTPEDYSENRFNFYVISDSGRNGHYDQVPVAETMGRLAESIEPEFIAAAGDTHHHLGVGSTSDPLWMTNYEQIYSHPGTMVPWYAVCGNHEYQGSTQAILDYTSISRRWEAPDYYFSKYFEDKGTSLLVLMIDTTPLIDKYRKDSGKYPDAVKQDMGAQLAWIEKSLKESKATWKVVIGHHPIYADTSKSPSERGDMQSRVDVLLRKYGVDAYVCGHIHNFQHIRKEGTDMDYIVNTSASLTRDVKEVDGTVFCSSDAGFSIFSIDKSSMLIHFIGINGQTVYTAERLKR